MVEESSGNLGHGTFRWDCVDDTDPTCGTGEFPRAVAVGSLFDLEFTPDSDLPSEITFYSIESVSPRRIDVDGDDFLVRGEGEVTMLVTGDGYGVDYIVLDGLPVDQLILERRDYVDDDETTSDTALAQVGVDVGIRALPHHRGRRLAGALAYEWDNLTPEVLELVTSAGNDATLRGLREGVARLSVRAGDYAEIIELTVVEAPPEPATTGGTEGSGSDTGGESGSTGDSGRGTDGETDMGSGTAGDTEGGSSTGGGQ